MVQDPQIFALGSSDIRAVLEEFVLERAADREVGDRTILWYRAQIGLFIRFLTEHGYPTHLPDLTEAHLRAYRLYLRGETRWDGKGRSGRPLADGTRAGYERALRAFFTWAADPEVGHLAVNPLARLKRPKVRRKPLRFLTDDELAAIWRTFHPRTRRGQRDRTLFLLLLDSGVRASEMVTLRAHALNPVTGTITIVGKGEHTREVGISPDTMRQVANYVRRWRQDCDVPELLLHAVKRQALTYNSLKPIFDRWEREAGIQTPFSAHSFRRTMATRAVRAGADGLVVAAQLGHSSLAMTKQYVQEAGLDLGTLAKEHSPLKGLKLR